jgi:sec-independent protein translocase protein TatC
MTKKSSTSPLIEGSERYMPFLMEVRRRAVLIGAVFFISSALGFIYYERIIRVILRTFELEGINIVFTSPFQFINLAINSALMVGAIVVFPMLIWQIIMFVRPALTKAEFKITLSLLPMSIILFLTGMSFGVVIMRWVITLFYAKSVELNIGNYLDVSQLLAQAIMTGVLMGVAFQFPVVLTMLLKTRMIAYEALASKRLIAYGISLVFAAILPPTDLLSLVLLTAPLIILFELTLALNRYILKTHV